jgi:8-oxo-dGTP diphosphatase
LNESPLPNPQSPPPIHVVAAIVRDAQDRVLLAQRGPHGDFPGAWEFPGGKVEAGESAIEALRRELREELGIEVGVARPLIAVPQRYADKSIVLDVHELETYSGAPHGREGQVLRWVAPAELAAQPMPPADRPVVAALSEAPLCLVTPDPGVDDEAFLATLARALHQVGRVQLRLPPALPAARARRLVRDASALVAERGVELLLNSGHPLVPALAVEHALGMHLRAAELAAPPPGVRPVAASCHDAGELQAAQRLGCRFALLGPLHSTATHPGAPPLGWEGFAALRAHVSLPVYALGGLAPADLATARAHGAQGVAAIRALWPAPSEPTRN